MRVPNPFSYLFGFLSNNRAPKNKHSAYTQDVNKNNRTFLGANPSGQPDTQHNKAQHVPHGVSPEPQHTQVAATIVRPQHGIGTTVQSNNASYGGFPTASYGGFPTTSYGGFPDASYGGFPTSSYGGFPTASYGGFPDASYGGFPTASYGGFPTASYGGFPTANYGGFPTTSDYSAINKPLKPATSSLDENGLSTDGNVHKQGGWGAGVAASPDPAAQALAAPNPVNTDPLKIKDKGEGEHQVS